MSRTAFKGINAFQRSFLSQIQKGACPLSFKSLLLTKGMIIRLIPSGGLMGFSINDIYDSTVHLYVRSVYGTPGLVVTFPVNIPKGGFYF